MFVSAFRKLFGVNSQRGEAKRPIRQVARLQVEHLEQRELLTFATLVKDINTGAVDSTPAQMTVLNNKLYFFADEGNGHTLFVSNGTQAGTHAVRDNAGNFIEDPAYMIAYDHKLLFTAETRHNGNLGNELWISDGTPAGTRLFQDINPGGNDSDPKDFVVANGRLFFTAENPLGRTLYVIDGSGGGNLPNAQPVLSFTGTPFAAPNSMIAVESRLFFAENNKTELWATDGVVPPVQMKTLPLIANIDNLVPWGNRCLFTATVLGLLPETWYTSGFADVNPLTSKFAYRAVGVNGKLYFATPANHVPGVPAELDVVVGTEITQLHANFSDVDHLVSLGGKLFFAANENGLGSRGLELWKSDGTVQGTILAADINPGAGDSKPENLIGLGSSLFFTATDGQHGTELWKYSLLTGNFQMVRDIRVGAIGSKPLEFIRSQGTIYFSADDGTVGRELWKVIPDDVSTKATLETSADPVPFEQPPTITATVKAKAPDPGIPTGIVKFYADNENNLIGTGTLNAQGKASITPAVGVLTPGNHTILARYQGDGGFAASTAMPISLTVEPLAFSTTEGRSLALPITTFDDPRPDATTGDISVSVQWGDGMSSSSPADIMVTQPGGPGTSFVLTGSHTYAEEIPTGSPGPVSITISDSVSGFSRTYSGTVAVADASISATGGSLSGYTNQPVSGQIGSITDANTSATASDFTVTIYWGDSSSSAGSVSGDSGTFTITGSHSYSQPGTYPLTIHVVDDGGSTADANGSVTVTPAPLLPTTTTVSGPSSAYVSQSVTFSATVAPVSPYTGTPTGTVTFYEGFQSLGVGRLTNGMAIFSTSSLSAGTHSITGRYSGDTQFLTSSSMAFSITIIKVSTTLALTSSSNPSFSGNSFTLTAMITPTVAGGVPVTGNVFFSFDGGNIISVSASVDATGRATITHAFNVNTVEPRQFDLLAIYNGDSHYLGSTGHVLQSVRQIATTTTITSSINPSFSGESFTLSATVVPTVTGQKPPSGYLIFSYGDGSFIGSGYLDAGGHLSISNSIQTSTVSPSSFPIIATYFGDILYHTSIGQVIQSVRQIGTTTVLISSVSPSASGQSFTLTATVTPGVTGQGPLTGNVYFASPNGVNIGTIPVDASGHASITYSISFGYGLPPTDFILTATYGGSVLFHTSSGQTSQTVLPPPAAALGAAATIRPPSRLSTISGNISYVQLSDLDLAFFAFDTRKYHHQHNAVLDSFFAHDVALAR